MSIEFDRGNTDEAAPQGTAGNTAPLSPPPSRDIEDAIRRQILAERAAAVNVSAPTPIEPQEGTLRRWQKSGGVLGTVATVLLLAAKFFAPLISLLKVLPFGKFLLTGGTMLISVFAYAATMGWPLGVGLVLMLFVHECGHAFAARRLGHAFSFMIFVPFMGALVAHRRGGTSAAQDAYVGIMGPYWGTAFGIVAFGIYYATGNVVFLGLAWLTFLINLFNLAPTPPLDGGWIVPLFSPKLLAVGMVLLLIIARHNPLIWLLAIMSLPRVIAGWKATPESDPYFHATKAERWRYGLLYLGLALFLAVAVLYSQDAMHHQNRATLIA